MFLFQGNPNFWMAFKWISTSSRFRKSNWSSDFGHAVETGNGAKKRVVLRREIFLL